MKQRPIIFNTEMVQAILDGRKTQTRRAITDKQLSLFKCAASIGECHYLDDDINPKSMGYYRQFCQFGEFGDQLYVRETWRLFNSSDECGCSESPCSCPSNGTVLFKASHDNGDSKWKPSIHMPRSAARIILEVTDIRVERVQDISERDAWAEGFDGYDDDVTGGKNGYSEFCEAWQSIYGEQSWQSNPWVWVIEFRVISTTGGAA
ncbi:hypothetical protein L5M28_07285 [Shewanella sp. SW32]|uniref:hypothetical protein n=1 Tax=unclassified Shewanella TaxID=196818 RepID=UPI0021D91791|nr:MULTISPECIES: hypothetical protein [unclassified Shewanella]MCU7962380.1 hypothetical protein [Shewanella sp. SW32]MCU7971289.1 hypothetical protein [Shewanella sp. SW29]